jgi:hypothetical protein
MVNAFHRAEFADFIALIIREKWKLIGFAT